MVIACLGWGSLWWRPEKLPVEGTWHEDGPVLPVEFARVSGGGKITLVLTDLGASVRTLWVPLAVETLDAAVAALAEREGLTKSMKPIGRAPSDSHYPFSSVISDWAQKMGLDGVVWTALKPGMDDKSRGPVPTLDQLRAHVATLGTAQRGDALEYIERAPPQIITPYRESLRALLANEIDG